ncbi:MAG: cyclic nucleotide-binding domain-containing protein [Gammaproteobacteria bacterium]|nr:cyclic nucleotide-binding domain-containing protein [Gammaproteobacteria bacterium]
MIKNIIEEITQDPAFVEGLAWKKVDFDTNHYIFKEGEVGGSIFFIVTGELRVISNVELENHKHIHAGFWDLKAGDVFGEMALHETQTRSANVMGLTQGSLYELDGERLSIYLDANPIKGYLFYKYLFELISEKLKHSNHRVNSLFAWGMKIHEIDKEIVD